MVDSKSDEIKNLFEKLEEIQSESQRSVDHEVKKLSTDNKNLKDKILNYQQKMQIWELEIQVHGLLEYLILNLLNQLES